METVCPFAEVSCLLAYLPRLSLFLPLFFSNILLFTARLNSFKKKKKIIIIIIMDGYDPDMEVFEKK
jgi:hypothetical protein